ncbi:MAG TPA: alpha/beta fold hydrolase [Xanthomonadaceae bacterium]|nr:alpha/beta fold hydrolase [Xanthomonadaceae bacterium]
MKHRQRVHYLEVSDGTRLAWAEAGKGPILVKAANWLTHLEYEWTSPVWQHWMHFFSERCRFVRYDERGCGMSDWRSGSLSLDLWADDLAAVIEAAAPQGDLVLLGISQGAATCIQYALRHPERVSKLILYGGYARGVFLRGSPKAEAAYRAIIELARVAWSSDNPAFRQVFTSRFIPGGSPEQLGWYNDLSRRVVSGEIAAELMTARATIDVSDRLAEIRCPTIVLHARGDEMVPIEEGRILASGIPGAEFIELESRNHVLLDHEPAWQRFCEEVATFLGTTGNAAAAVFSGLSTREREVLACMTEGLSNADIAERMGISEKTVRNHASNLFDKLGVWSRAQAIVFARDRGFV